MQFRVVIPEHVRSGQYIKVHCPADTKVKGSVGREAELRVPKGLKPGDSFVFDISDKDSSITIASDVTNLNSQIAASNNNNNNNNNRSNNSNNNKNNNNNNNKNGNKNSSSSSSSSSGGGGNFLDREVLHLRDFVVALGIGLIIGVSIVIGFVMGVLSATSGLTEADIAAATSGNFHQHQHHQHQHQNQQQQQQQHQLGKLNHNNGGSIMSAAAVGGGVGVGSQAGSSSMNPQSVGVYQLGGGNRQKHREL